MIGALQGFIIAYLQVPAFIVTLGGLLIWRGATFIMTTGRTVAPMDVTYQWFGGGHNGTIGATASWVGRCHRLHRRRGEHHQRAGNSGAGSISLCAPYGRKSSFRESVALR